MAGALLLLLAYLVLQSFVVIAHEFAHSTTAWLLGYTPTPFTVVWGNPITIQGWDEGVPYDCLFPSAGHLAEAAIGGMPLLMHTVFAIVGLLCLQRLLAGRRKKLFFALYVFFVINLAELIAYIVMRPFIPTGDTGRFNEGTGLSPWVLFGVGLAFLASALAILAGRIRPALDCFTDGSRIVHWAIVASAAFIMFLWGSGIRFMSLYPDPLWRVGLLGVAGFFGWLLVEKSAYRKSAPPGW